MDPLIEVNFDGIVGPSHNFAGLSVGNMASLSNENAESNPKAAALQGLDKMRAVADLGARQGVLPPHVRPCLQTLRRLGFSGPPERVLAEVAAREPRLMRLVSSASAMWAANAATVAPATDTTDGKLHIVPANLRHMFHRSIEADTTRDVLRAIFRDDARFVVHEPLPGGSHFADEGAANHLRLASSSGRFVHVFAWGRYAFDHDEGGPRRFPARQTWEASSSLARLLALPSDAVLLVQQHPDGIDHGAFHSDVLAVANGNFLMLHDLAFSGCRGLIRDIEAQLRDELKIAWASQEELPVSDAVNAYPFNSQVVTVPADAGGGAEMVLVAPLEARESKHAHAFIERVVAGDNPVARAVFLDVRQSMRNGGGPACLRQRIPMRQGDIEALGARVLFDAELERELRAWVQRHYRDRLQPVDLQDVALWHESLSALDELTRILRLGSVYEFQR